MNIGYPHDLEKRIATLEKNQQKNHDKLEVRAAERLDAWLSDFDKRIIALENQLENITTDKGLLATHEDRLAALERHLDEHFKYISTLQDKVTDYPHRCLAALETLISKTSIGSIEELGERIAALEQCTEELSIECPRLSALEAASERQDKAGVAMMEWRADQEKRIAALQLMFLIGI